MSDQVSVEIFCSHCGVACESSLCQSCFEVHVVDELEGGEVNLQDGTPAARDDRESEEVFIPSEFPGVDTIAEFCGVTLSEKERDEWRERLVPLVCTMAKLDEVDSQFDLLNSFDDRFSQAVFTLLGSFQEADCRELRTLPSQTWRLNWVVGKLEESNGADPQAELRERRRLGRQARVAAELAARPAPVLSPPKVPTGFVLFRQDERWGELLPAAQRVFRVMFSRATNRSKGERFWCEVGVGLLMKATGYKNRQVRNALKQLRDRGWIGYVVQIGRDGRVKQLRGRPRRGCSRYWLVRHPGQIAKS